MLLLRDKQLSNILLFNDKMKINNMNMKTEIMLYYSKIEIFMFFINYIKTLWWDKLYPFKDQMVVRPSRSGNRIREMTRKLSEQIIILKNSVKSMVYSSSYEPEIVIRKVHRVTTAQIVDKKGIDLLRITLASKRMIVTVHQSIVTPTISVVTGHHSLVTSTLIL